jgi:FtsH-binding integral membrane protein
MQPRIDQRPGSEDHTECRGTWLYGTLLIGGTGAFVVTFSVSLLNPPIQPWPLWVCWGLSIVCVLLAIAETILLRVVMTSTTLSVRRVWSHRHIPLSDLRSLQRVKGDYVLKRSQGMWLYIPAFITNHAILIERLQRVIAANVLSEVSGLSESQRRLASQALRDEAHANAAAERRQ